MPTRCDPSISLILSNSVSESPRVSQKILFTYDTGNPEKSIDKLVADSLFPYENKEALHDPYQGRAH